MEPLKVVEALQKNRYEAQYFATAEEAKSYLQQELRGKLIGFGDSVTFKQLGLFELLSKNNKIYDPKHLEEGETFVSTAKKCLTTEVFLTSVNAMTETGIMVNMDGTGNRVGSSLFGHDKVYFILGVNKIVPTVEAAIERIKTVAAPQNCKLKGLKTPCAVTGHCMDCNSPDRICNMLAIHYKKMRNTRAVEVVIIGENLGF